jgi:hypothetical protein
MGSILYDGIHFKRLTAFLVLLIHAHGVEKAVLEIKDGIANSNTNGADVEIDPLAAHDAIEEGAD